MNERPFLERHALRYLSRLSTRSQVRRDQRVHILDAEERAELKRIQAGAVTRSAVVGALSSVVAGLAEVYATAEFPAALGAPLMDLMLFWGFVMAVTVVASALEIAFLYWDALRSVHRLASAAGLPLEVVEGEGVASALARAALELPNPPERVLGVNPRREVSKLRILAAAFFYKGKIALTSFILRLLVRRILTRVLVRTALLLPFVSVPVTAIWNAIVTRLVLREARIRALGPSAVQEGMADLTGGGAIEGKLGEVMVRAVASSIVRTQSLHPNLRQLLIAVHENVSKDTDVEDVDSPARFIEELKQLSPDERRLALRLLGFAAIIDGRISTRERKLVTDASRACGIELQPKELDGLRVAFVRGDGLLAGSLPSLAPVGVSS